MEGRRPQGIRARPPGNLRETRLFVLVVTLAWAVAFVVLMFTDRPGWWTGAAGAGVVVGILGLTYLARLRD